MESNKEHDCISAICYLDMYMDKNILDFNNK